VIVVSGADRSLTSNAGEQLPSKALDLTARERHEAVALQEVENTLAQQICDYTDMVAEVETVAKVYAFVAVFLVVHGKSGEYSQLDSRCIAVFLHRTYYLHGTSGLPSLVECLDNFSKGALAEQFDDVV